MVYKLYLNTESKYKNKLTEYKGRTYHSMREAEYAKELDLLIKAKQIKSWTPQFTLSLDVNGKHLADYIIDFRIVNNDNSIELVEIKGYETDVWKLKFKLAKILFEDKFIFKVIN